MHSCNAEFNLVSQVIIMFRTRRLRKTEGVRRLVRETKLSVDDFVYPLFIEEGENIKTEIASMPGIFRYSLDLIAEELEEIVGSDETAAALKEALIFSTDTSVSKTSKTNGYFSNAAIKIVFPEEAENIQKILQLPGVSTIGQPLLDGLELKMNQAAEKAAPVARDIFVNAITNLTITDALGCTTADSIIIYVNLPICDEPNVFVPNAFSPDGDGYNDIIYVEGIGITSLNFKIYNRWGELIFESNDQSIGWDGQYNNVDQEMEVYTYILEAIFRNEKNAIIKGNITLLR